MLSFDAVAYQWHSLLRLDPVSADYRVPQVLRPEGVMVYSDELAKLVDSKTEIPAGSEVKSRCVALESTRP